MAGNMAGRWRRGNLVHQMMLLATKCVSDGAWPSELRPASIDGEFGASCEGRVECEEEDGLSDFLRRPPAFHRNHACHLVPDVGNRVFIGKYFAEDRRVDGTGRHRVDANLLRVATIALKR